MSLANSSRTTDFLLLGGRAQACDLISSGPHRPVAVDIHDHQRPMDPAQPRTAPPVIDQEEDEWDTDGFVIPSLGIEEPDQGKVEASEEKILQPPPIKTIEEETIYLGPHGAPPSQSTQSKQQETSLSGHKQRLKHKLKEADRKFSGSGRENKLENLRELVGVGKANVNMQKGSPRDWLDPHCHESQFEKRNPQ